MMEEMISVEERISISSPPRFPRVVTRESALASSSDYSLIVLRRVLIQRYNTPSTSATCL